MIVLPLSYRRRVRALVEEAREKGPKQPWIIPPKPAVSDSNKGRFGHRSGEFRQDPKAVFAPEIAQSFADGALAAFENGFLEIAFLRARSAADRERENCKEPGIYQQLFTLVGQLAEELGREKGKKKMATEQEQLKEMEEELHKISVKALGIRRHKITKALLGVIEQIKGETAPKKPTQLELPKTEGE
jgi:hypothetical protein